MSPLRLLPLVLVLAACAGGAKTAAEISALSTEQLVEECTSPAARSQDYLRFDPAYRPLLLRELHKRLGWTDIEHQKVLERLVWIGATEQQVLCSWGYPRTASKHVSGDGVVKYWRYGDLLRVSTMVALRDGRVTDWTRDS